LSDKRKIFTKQKKRATDMKRIFVATVTLAILAVFLSSAQAAINIEVAEVQNWFAFIKGNNAAKGAQITWGNAVTTANKNNGGFSFNGAVPNDCIGELSDGVSTINVQCSTARRYLQPPLRCHRPG
jgi:hypothetical protein